MLDLRLQSYILRHVFPVHQLVVRFDIALKGDKFYINQKDKEAIVHQVTRDRRAAGLSVINLL